MGVETIVHFGKFHVSGKDVLLLLASVIEKMCASTVTKIALTSGSGLILFTPHLSNLGP